MTHDEATFTGASGGPIFWQSWSPGTVKAVVVLVHGISEHTGRYAHVAERLNDAGYAVFAPDHQGHGRSGGTPGNIGRMAWVRADLDHVRRLGEAAYPGLPVFVLGHSLGGLIALDYVIDRGQEGLAGLALSGAAVDPSVGSALEKKLAPLLSALVPNAPVVDLGSDGISRDPAVVVAYRADPLVYNGKVRARSGAETLAATARVSARMGELSLPVLIMHGSGDTLAAPAGSRLVNDRIGSRDKTLRMYDGLFHEIFNEPEQDQVLDDLADWLDQHVPD